MKTLYEWFTENKDTLLSESPDYKGLMESLFPIVEDVINNHKDHNGGFVITSLSREDLNQIEFDGDAADDLDLRTIAVKLADDYCNQLFWGSLEIIATDIVPSLDGDDE